MEKARVTCRDTGLGGSGKEVQPGEREIES